MAATACFDDERRSLKEYGRELGTLPIGLRNGCASAAFLLEPMLYRFGHDIVFPCLIPMP
jgi:hypothetical protein